MQTGLGSGTCSLKAFEKWASCLIRSQIIIFFFSISMLDPKGHNDLVSTQGLIVGTAQRRAANALI